MFAMWLVLALVWAQWAGLAHRIEHAAGVPAQASTPSQASDHAAIHSCVVFDGLCLADVMPTAVVPVLEWRMALPMPPATAFASWHALFVSHFLSRGPPAA